MEKKECSWCSGEESNTNVLIAGQHNVYICSNCIHSAYMIVFGDVEPSEAEYSVDSAEEEIDFLRAIRK